MGRPDHTDLWPLLSTARLVVRRGPRLGCRSMMALLLRRRIAVFGCVDTVRRRTASVFDRSVFLAWLDLSLSSGRALPSVFPSFRRTICALRSTFDGVGPSVYRARTVVVPWWSLRGAPVTLRLG
jgi:hypothetical protein